MTSLCISLLYYDYKAAVSGPVRPSRLLKGKSLARPPGALQNRAHVAVFDLEELLPLLLLLLLLKKKKKQTRNAGTHFESPRRQHTDHTHLFTPEMLHLRGLERMRKCATHRSGRRAFPLPRDPPSRCSRPKPRRGASEPL